MCPNCILNQAGLSGGLYVAFGICLLFFIVGLVAIFWAFRNGEFENTEDIKFDMLDDGEDGEVAKKAREALQQARQKAV
jgi:nitrogen fixation-related uncharacterized protein